MFDEYEIACWINFIDRFNFFNFCYDVNDVSQVLNSAFTNIVYIAAATKFITNDDQKLKDQIFLNVLGREAIREFNKFIGNPDFGNLFDVHLENPFLKNHQIIKQLEKGFEKEYEPDLMLPDVADRVNRWSEAANQLNSEVQENIRVYEASKNNLNVIVDQICSQGLKKRKNNEKSSESSQEKPESVYPAKRLSERHKSTQE